MYNYKACSFRAAYNIKKDYNSNKNLQNDDDLDVDDLLVILACLEGKENNVDGRLDPRCPMDNGRFVMNVVEMLNRISKIKENIKKKLV